MFVTLESDWLERVTLHSMAEREGGGARSRARARVKIQPRNDIYTDRAWVGVSGMLRSSLCSPIGWNVFLFIPRRKGEGAGWGKSMGRPAQLERRRVKEGDADWRDVDCYHICPVLPSIAGIKR